MAVFRGPGVLMWQGRPVQPGDRVGMSPAEVEHHRRFAGLKFDDDLATSGVTPADVTAGTAQPTAEAEAAGNKPAFAFPAEAEDAPKGTRADAPTADAKKP